MCIVKDIGVSESDVGFNCTSLADDGGLDVGFVGDASVGSDESIGTDFACSVGMRIR